MRKLLLALLCLLALPVAGQELSGLERSLDAAVERAMASGDAPGAVLLVGRGDSILLHKAYGYRDVETQDPLQVDDLFDLASLTKALVTAPAVLMLAQQGRLDLQAPVSEYLEVDWRPCPTVGQLLTHHGGLPPVPQQNGFPKTLLKTTPVSPPGERFVYSDTGYLVLQDLVEKVSGRGLDSFYQSRIAAPLGITQARFRPEEPGCVPTFGVSPGKVHDPRASKMGGVAGHAGLFGTALAVHQELSRLEKILSPEFRKLYFQEQAGGRSYGLDVDTRFSSARGDRFSPMTSAGHTGFTGTSFWWDRPTGWHVVLLTSRLHPDNKGSSLALRREVATLVAEYALGKQVRPGLDVWVEESVSQLDDKKWGVVCNHTTRDRFGRHLLERLPRLGFKPERIFTPEHGLFGTRDEKIEHGVHEGLGVPLYSLYGEDRRPREEWFQGLDVLLFDLQDVGVRYYTYISTLKYCLETARKTGVKVVVLDRPNPLGGEVVDGHLAEEFSFIGCDALPTVHGMTMGEMARFLNRDVQAELEVVPMQGWHRSMIWEDTGLPFLSPSPNLAELESVRLYPIIGQIEWCGVSVGRGTRSPFRVFGAPYIRDPEALALDLNREFRGELQFEPRFFIPESSVFQGEVCGGVEVTALKPLPRPAQLGLRLASLLDRRYSPRFELEAMSRHLGRSQVRKVMKAPVQSELWRDIRRDYLLY